MTAEPAPRAASRGRPQKLEPRLIAITDRTVATAAATLARFERLARAARPFTVLFQLRDHDLSGRERLEFGRALRALSAAEQQCFQVNDRCDLAVLLGADAVHLGERSVSAAEARKVVGAELYVSRACHDPEGELERGVDAWVLSPIFGERKGRAPLGVEGVHRLAERCRTAGGGGGGAVFALGGVTAEDVSECRKSGAWGVAAIGAVLGEAEPTVLLQALGILR